MTPYLMIGLLLAFGVTALYPTEATAEFNSTLPFWAQPYPNGYARRHNCIVKRAVDTPEGIIYETYSICGPVLRERS